MGQKGMQNALFLYEMPKFHMQLPLDYLHLNLKRICLTLIGKFLNRLI